METYNEKYSKQRFWPSKDDVDPFSLLLLQSTTMNSRNEARDNQMRILKGGKKKVSWFETPGLEEQHSSRVSRVLPPKRRSHPDQVFPNS